MLIVEARTMAKRATKSVSQTATGTQRIRYDVEDKSIVAASHTVMGYGILPHRIVLRDDGRQYITHVEVLSILSIAGSVVADIPTTILMRHSCFENGHYFLYGGFSVTKEEASKEAKLDFDERVKSLR